MEYQVIYSNRKTIQLAVERNREVVVRVPYDTSREKIEEIIKKKRLWLYEKRNHKQKYPQVVPKKEFVNGETLLYLGRHYSLSVVDKKIEGVEFDHRFYISRANQHQAVELFKRWHMTKAGAFMIFQLKFRLFLAVQDPHLYFNSEIRMVLYFTPRFFA